MIVIESSSLKEIKKVDLEPFTKLRFIYLTNNHIEFLENDLFEGNLNLEIVNIDLNRIRLVGIEILKPLTNLKQISLLNNQCINEAASNSSAIDALSKTLVEKCSPSYVHYFMQKISNLEKQINQTNQEQKAEKSRITSLKSRIDSITDESSLAEKKLSKRYHELKSAFDLLITNLTKNSYTTNL